MFSTGQWIFAALFFAAFVSIMIVSYRRDKQIHERFYKGNYKVLIAFIVFVFVLFLIKIFMKR